MYFSLFLAQKTEKTWYLRIKVVFLLPIKTIVVLIYKLRIMKKKLKVFTLPIEEFNKKFAGCISVTVPSIPKGHVAKVVSVRAIAEKS